jgi:hypothetical protein
MLHPVGFLRLSAPAAIAALACVLTLAACDVLLGLDPYRDVACAFDCGASAGDGAETALGLDALQESDITTPADAQRDASANEVATPEGGWPIPTGQETWAHWPMPNPDAAIAPDSSTPLPHTMAYDAGADGDDPIVYDQVTQLRWSRQAQSASDYDSAWRRCSALDGTGWRVPTRIELVSLIDFTQPPGSATLDPTVFFSVQGARTWTSSAVAAEGGSSGYWSVDFASGLTTSSGPLASQVLCVNGGAP